MTCLEKSKSAFNLTVDAEKGAWKGLFKAVGYLSSLKADIYGRMSPTLPWDEQS